MAFGTAAFSGGNVIENWKALMNAVLTLDFEYTTFSSYILLLDMKPIPFLWQGCLFSYISIAIQSIGIGADHVWRLSGTGFQMW
jgi:hypothetical protein